VRLRVAVLSDLNSRYGSKRYMPAVHAAARALVERVRPDLVLITGDMVAGQKSGLDYRGMWNAFHASVTDPLLQAGIPVAPTPGNHDAAPGFAAERKHYVAQWRDPNRSARVEYLDDSNYPLHYSFEHGGVFFAAVDATAVGPLRGRQHDWLDEQLGRTQAGVKIVFGHLPIHPFARQREREILDDGELEQILRRHDVSAYVSGHHHAYYPGAVDGVRHVAVPCLGAGARALIGRSQRSAAALLVIDIDESGIAALEALQAPEFDEVVERDALPPRIELGRHTVVRDDLAAD
jgi:predicted MPP superfamily phosphohydrolase